MSSTLIAGDSNGIGRATAAELARRGHRAVATGVHRHTNHQRSEHHGVH